MPQTIAATIESHLSTETLGSHLILHNGRRDFKSGGVGGRLSRPVKSVYIFCARARVIKMWSAASVGPEHRTQEKGRKAHLFLLPSMFEVRRWSLAVNKSFTLTLRETCGDQMGFVS